MDIEPEIINNLEQLKREKKRISQKKYYENNKEKVFELQYKTVHCEYCNLNTKVYRLSKHRKTAKHLRNVEKFNLQVPALVPPLVPPFDVPLNDANGVNAVNGVVYDV